MTTMAALSADLLETVAIACAKCWRAANPPPRTLAPVLLYDYKLDYARALHREDLVFSMAVDNGYDGTANDLQYAAHREAYARTGDDADLARMLRHVP